MNSLFFFAVNIWSFKYMSTYKIDNVGVNIWMQTLIKSRSLKLSKTQIELYIRWIWNSLIQCPWTLSSSSSLLLSYWSVTVANIHVCQLVVVVKCLEFNVSAENEIETSAKLFKWSHNGRQCEQNEFITHTHTTLTHIHTRVRFVSSERSDSRVNQKHLSLGVPSRNRKKTTKIECKENNASRFHVLNVCERQRANACRNWLKLEMIDLFQLAISYYMSLMAIQIAVIVIQTDILRTFIA